MMKKFFIFFLVFLAFVKGNSQVLDPVKWTTKVEKKTENTYIVKFEGTIEKDWHMYSQFTAPGGSLPMELTFVNKNTDYRLVGKAEESKTKTAFNTIFEVNETYFEHNATIVQEIKVLNPSITKIEAKIDYQVCKEVCINLKKEFVFLLPKINENSTVSAVKKINTDTIRVDSLTPSLGESNKMQVEDNVNSNQVIADDNSSSNRGLWSIFFIAFLSGFAALLTPCVFPLIPMTVSFFTKQSKTRAAGIRNAIFYGLSIIIIYVLLGTLITGIFGANALNQLSTNVWFNLIFFIILVIFAVSFLGAFEIVLPYSWANKVDAQADKGGFLGILFMALALAIVSFSCTGPIVGTLLVEAASKGGIAPIIGMLGFSLALALPFMFFALFPGWLNTLPKSGSWLNTVKVVLGFLELALAFKFLSNADLVLQLHLLEREVFLGIWIAIFWALALYLFGLIKLPHDNPIVNLSVGRILSGLVVLAFTIYLIPGLWGAPLRLVSAFTPPIEYSESPNGVGNKLGSINSNSIPQGAKVGVHGLIIFDDYENGLDYAKKVNKPIILDFTGFACVNCRKMENNVWSNSNILTILKNDIVLISLYVDDKRDLPKNKQFISKTTGLKIQTIGDKWTDFMISKYKTNTQPLYVLTDLKGNSLNTSKPTISYVGVEEYRNWLIEGLANYKK